MEGSTTIQDGFFLARDHFALPLDAMALDPKTKRALTICNINHRLCIIDIVRVLDEDVKNVIGALLEYRAVQDRRATLREDPEKEQKKRLFHRSWTADSS